jgi:hypothetical protein
VARELNPNLYPSRGYVFVERDGSVHRADGWKSLRAKVTRYREDNHFELGDVWGEIQTQICGASPSACRDSEPTTKSEKDDASGMSFNQRVLAWLGWALGRKRVNAWTFVSHEEQSRRAGICALCPKQQALSKACESCITSIHSARRALLDSREPAFQNLHPCSVLREDCVSSVAVNLPPSNNPELPPNCWRRGA